MEKLDLHGLRHDDARRETIHFIEDHWCSGKEVEIITGNSKKMKEIVEQVLKEYKLTYRIGNPFDFYNFGYIVTELE